LPLSLFVLRRHSERSEEPLYLHPSAFPRNPKINPKICRISASQKPTVHKPPSPRFSPHLHHKSPITLHLKISKTPWKTAPSPQQKSPAIEIKSNWMYHHICSDFVPSYEHAVNAPARLTEEMSGLEPTFYLL
jgi:hypothetical protein